MTGRHGAPATATGDFPYTCPLCGWAETVFYARDRHRHYGVCARCALVSVPERFHLSQQEEKAEYDLHRNHLYDQAYRRFLSRLCNPLCKSVPAGAAGLDFGCGPGPALAEMFRESGYDMEVYDKFYARDPTVFSRRYDFITASEVLEHLEQPGLELERLFGLLHDGGIMGIMTKLVSGREAFLRWHYKNDPTHICYFSRKTFRWLGERLQAGVEFIGSDVILLRRTSRGGEMSAPRIQAGEHPERKPELRPGNGRGCDNCRGTGQ